MELGAGDAQWVQATTKHFCLKSPVFALCSQKQCCKGSHLFICMSCAASRMRSSRSVCFFVTKQMLCFKSPRRIIASLSEGEDFVFIRWLHYIFLKNCSSQENTNTDSENQKTVMMCAMVKWYLYSRHHNHREVQPVPRISQKCEWHCTETSR